MNSLWNNSSAANPVTATILLFPADSAVDSVILNIPISPVLLTCVPPHNSAEKLGISITLTHSGLYFSPKIAVMPFLIAL